MISSARHLERPAPLIARVGDRHGDPSGSGSTVSTSTFDVRNRLATFTVWSSPTVCTTYCYTYDDAGNRVAESGGGTTTYYLTDTANPTGYAQPLEEKASTSAAPCRSYVLGDRPLGQADSAAVAYLLADGHGSTRALTNTGGCVTAVFNYDAFGSAVGSWSLPTAGTVFLFGGDAIYDPASGLYFHGNGIRARDRFRFISMDSYAGDTQDPLSLHKYLYASANPTNGSDPSGHMDLISTVGTIGIGLQMMGEAGMAIGSAGILGGLLGLVTFGAMYYGETMVMNLAADNHDRATVLGAAANRELAWQGVQISAAVLATGFATYFVGALAAGAGAYLVATAEAAAAGGYALKNGYYDVQGFRFSQYYYEKLWSNGRQAPSIVANAVLEGCGGKGVPDAIKPGFIRYVYGGWEMVYNPTTREVWHLQPID